MSEKNSDSNLSTSNLVDEQVDLEAEGLLGTSSPVIKARNRIRNISWTSLHIGLIVLYSLLFLWYTRYYAAYQACQPMLYSPADGVVRRVTKTVDGLQGHNIYAGKPNEESEAAWHELLSNINIRVTPDELKKLGQESVELKEGGYLATLGVYHELHCVKRLRKFYHKDYFYPNRTEELEAELAFHADHCIELLRQAAICRGDTTITSFEFRNQNPSPFVKNGATHECVEWEPLRNWAASRKVDLWNNEILVHPWLKS